MADLYGRTGGPFLDQIEAEQREVRSARIEARQPDFSLQNLAPTALKLIPEVALKVDVTSEDALNSAIAELEAHKTTLLTPDPEVSSLHPSVVNPIAPSNTVLDDEVTAPVASNDPGLLFDAGDSLDNL